MYEDLLKDPPEPPEEDIPDVILPPGPGVPPAGLCFAERL